MKRALARMVFRTIPYKNKKLKTFAQGVEGKRILEIGSGPDEYSVKRFFSESNEFIQSDIENYGNNITIDVLMMKYEGEFDIILCLNVLEHVYFFDIAVRNIYRALKPKGRAIFFVPAFYPLHSEPQDYWRFTEHALRKILTDFKDVKIEHSGIRQYPFAYYLETTK